VIKKFSTSRLAEFKLLSPNSKEARLESLPAAIISSCPIENREHGAAANRPCAPSVKVPKAANDAVGQGWRASPELSLTRRNEQKASAV
jgi:hypothetical protein